MKSQKKVTLYSLQKATNAVIKWTAIITALCLDKAR